MSKDKPRIWLSSPHMGETEQLFVKEAFDTNWIAPLGPNVDGFEHDLQVFSGVSHAAALSSGTAAIHLALIILGVERGDEVLVSSFTFSGSVNPIVYQGAVPIMIDSEMDTWNMDPGLLEEAILDRIRKTGKKPKALVLVHLYGMPAQLDEITRICKKHEIPMIEDAAEALGSAYKGQRLGSFGDFGIYSFNGNKIITTSGGGALLSDDEEVIKRARFLSTQARDNALHYEHSEIGYNYRMSNILAGIGRGQMQVLEERVAKRRAINEFYKSKLSSDGLQYLEEPSSDYYSNFWLTTAFIHEDEAGFSREELRMALWDDHIESRPLWKPMHMQPVFAHHPAYLNGVSQRLFENGLCLPSGSNMSENDLNRIYESFHKLINK